MKKNILLYSVWGASMLVASQAGAAFLGNSTNPSLTEPSGSDPFLADLAGLGLNVNYTYNSTTGIGTFNAFNSYSGGVVATVGDGYTTGSQTTGFSGSFSLTATIQQVSGVWSLTGGTFDVYGDLGGGGTGNLLLSGNLKHGAEGTAFGARDPGQTTKWCNSKL